MQARELPGRAFPQVLLQELMGVMSVAQPPQRRLTHLTLVQLLPVAPAGLRDTQALGLLSTIWHEVRPAVQTKLKTCLAAMVL